jgi:hypothetical protein
MVPGLHLEATPPTMQVTPANSFLLCLSLVPGVSVQPSPRALFTRRPPSLRSALCLWRFRLLVTALARALSRLIYNRACSSSATLLHDVLHDNGA